MDTYFYDAEIETREDVDNRNERMILASQVQPTQWIYHCQTRATTGWYEVVAVSPLFAGATSIKVKAVSEGGIHFQHSVVYLPGQRVEVVSK